MNIWSTVYIDIIGILFAPFGLKKWLWNNLKMVQFLPTYLLTLKKFSWRKWGTYRVKVKIWNKF
jgi:hypothetical protein